MADEPIPLHGSRPSDVVAAQKELEAKAAIISGNQFQPKLIWTIRPWSPRELTELIEAGGASPFRVVNYPMQLDRRVILWAGAPHWAQYGYLVMVEIKAVNVGG
jgi:hypothetical protein